jgi:hypothetical protein
VNFDVDTLTCAIGLMLIGVHISVFAISAKVFGMREGFLPDDPKFQRLFLYFQLESGLLLGIFFLLAGFVAMVYAVVVWRQASFGNLSPTHMLRLVLPAAASLMLGVEIVFSSFFLSLLGMRNR